MSNKLSLFGSTKSSKRKGQQPVEQEANNNIVQEDGQQVALDAWIETKVVSSWRGVEAPVGIATNRLLSKVLLSRPICSL